MKCIVIKILKFSSYASFRVQFLKKKFKKKNLLQHRNVNILKMNEFKQTKLLLIIDLLD